MTRRDTHAQYVERIKSRWENTIRPLLARAKSEGCENPIVVVMFDLDEEDVAKWFGKLGSSLVFVRHRSEFLREAKSKIASAHISDDTRKTELRQIAYAERPPEQLAAMAQLRADITGVSCQAIPIHYSGPGGHNTIWVIDDLITSSDLACNATGGTA